MPRVPRSALVPGALLCLLWAAFPHPAAAASAEDVSGHIAYRWGDSPRDEAGNFVWAADPPVEEGWTREEGLGEPPGRTGSMLWLRIDVPHGAWRDPALFLGGVNGAFEAWEEGRLVATGGVLRADGREEPMGVGWALVPLDPARPEAPLYLRLQSSTAGLSGIIRAARVGERAEHLQRVTRGAFFDFVLGALLLLLGLAAAAVRLALRQVAALGEFALYAMTAGLLLCGVNDVTPVLTDARTLQVQLVIVGLAGIGPALTWFTGALFPWPATGYRLLRNGLTAAAVLFAAVTLVRLDWSTSFIMVQVFAFVLGLGVAVVTAARAALAGDRDARIFVGGVVLLFVTSVTSSWLSIVAGIDGNVITGIGFLIFTATLGLLLVRRISRMATAQAERAREQERQQAQGRYVERLGTGAKELVLAVEKLRAVSRVQRAGLEKQASTLYDTRSTAEEIRQTSRMAADKADQLAAMADEAAQVGKAAETKVDESLQQLGRIGEEVGAMAGQMGGLERNTREIATIVDTVKSIADQLNMLALNAAIEATRSGEHGKGFAVVAREVRTLADRSIRETARIRSLLDGLAGAVRDTSGRSARGDEEVKTSLGRVRESGELLRGLADVVRETAPGVRQIAAAVGQQSAGIAQIFGAVSDQTKQMEEALAQLKEAEGAIDRVHAVAGEMANLAEGAAPAAQAA